MKVSLVDDRGLVIGLVSAILFSGCAVRPDDLAVPNQISCTNLQQPISFTGTYGIGGNKWTTRLERGPYWSEREDGKGTYYRAPPGGVSITAPDGKPTPGFQVTMDGGFYVPNDPNEPPRIYRYFSTEPTPAQVPPAETDCSTVGYVKDPATSKVGFLSVAAGGAVGGAAGGLAARALAPKSSMSYGQAAGIGAAGGAVAGLVVAAMINADVGKIVGGLPIQDTSFLEQLRKAHASRVPVKELPYSAVAGDPKTSAPSQAK